MPTAENAASCTRGQQQDGWKGHSGRCDQQEGVSCRKEGTNIWADVAFKDSSRSGWGQMANTKAPQSSKARRNREQPWDLLLKDWEQPGHSVPTVRTEFKHQQTIEYIQLDSTCLVLIQNLLSYWEAKTVCQYYYHQRAGINWAVFQTSDASQCWFIISHWVSLQIRLSQPHCPIHGY